MTNRNNLTFDRCFVHMTWLTTFWQSYDHLLYYVLHYGCLMPLISVTRYIMEVKILMEENGVAGES